MALSKPIVTSRDTWKQAKDKALSAILQANRKAKPRLPTAKADLGPMLEDLKKRVDEAHRLYAALKAKVAECGKTTALLKETAKTYKGTIDADSNNFFVPDRDQPTTAAIKGAKTYLSTILDQVLKSAEAVEAMVQEGQSL